MAPNVSSIAFIGLGTMGYPMACNLAKKLPDTKLYVYDIVTEAVQELSKEYAQNVTACTNAQDAANQADIIITMLPEGKHVHAVYLDSSSGLLQTDLTDKLLIDCSTIDTATSIAVREALSQSYPSASFYDAPVSGGSIGAERGTLTFMLGCDSATDANYSALLHPLLSLMGSNITACGGHSLGLTAKLCNNYCSAMIALATSETYNMAIRAGLDPRVLWQIFQSSTAGSTINDKWCPVPGLVAGVPSSNGYKPGFRLELMKKDISLAVGIGDQVGAKLRMGKEGLKVYEDACDDPKCQGLDSRVVYRYIDGIEDWDKGKST